MGICLPKVVPITSLVRRMRGGSQSQLIIGQDDSYYIAKFLGNPQGSRTLISEWIAGYLLKEIGIQTPELRVLRLPDSFDRSELFFYIGNHRKQVEGMLHLGSQCPVNPEKTAIFDFLPSRLLRQIQNITDFGRVFVVDCWLGQTDTRQAIYMRRKGTMSAGFCVWMIDQGFSLGGPEWDLRLAGDGSRYFDLTVYKLIDMPNVIEQTVQTILAIDQETLCAATRGVPEEWFAPGDRETLLQVFDHLQRRRKNLNDLVTRSWAAMEQRCSCNAIATK